MDRAFRIAPSKGGRYTVGMNGPSRLRIVILMHESYRGCHGRYVVELIAELWRSDGHDVVYLYGPGEFVAADVCLVHVDLSVVPDDYLDFARRYPVALNGRVRDVRKSTISRQRVRSADDWEGPVIVKSDLNFGGAPERLADARARGWLARLVRRVDRRVRRRAHAESRESIARHPLDYRIFERFEDVPESIRLRRDLVIERFIAERDGERYCVRNMSFLGERASCVRLAGFNPIVNGQTCDRVENVEPHPEALALRVAMDFDYGKFDYVEVDGRVVLLDANKTVGCDPSILEDPVLAGLRRWRADGLYDLLEAATRDRSGDGSSPSASGSFGASAR